MLFENLHGVALKVRNPPLALIVGGEADLEWGPEDVVDTHYIGYRDRSCVRTPSGAGGCRRTESRCGCRSIRRRGWRGMYTKAIGLGSLPRTRQTGVRPQYAELSADRRG